MKAIYHQESGAVSLEVLKDHGNGTVDLGRDEAVIVAKCQVSKEPVVGQCVLEPEPKPSKAEAEAAAKAEAEAAAKKAAK